MSKADNIYMLIRRRYSHETESYEYSSIGGPSSYDKIDNMALKKKGLYRDIYLMCDAALVSDIRNNSIEEYIVGNGGYAKKLPSPIIKLWEGNGVKPDNMIRLAVSAGVKPDIIIKSVLDSIRIFLHHIPKTERRMLNVFYEIEKFSEGSSSFQGVQKASSRISEDVERSTKISVCCYYVAYAISNAVWMLKRKPMDSSYEVDPGHVAQSIRYAMACGQSEGIDETKFAEVIRKNITLETMMLAMTKEPA